MLKFKRGDFVIKSGGDYIFEGVVLVGYRKCTGAIRYDVENPAGLIHIFNEGQLREHPGPSLDMHTLRGAMTTCDAAWADESALDQIATAS